MTDPSPGFLDRIISVLLQSSGNMEKRKDISMIEQLRGKRTKDINLPSSNQNKGIFGRLNDSYNPVQMYANRIGELANASKNR